MFIFDNFVHSDCHAGNLLIQSKVLKELNEYEKFVEKIQSKVFDLLNC
jgi:predicted unusual protein kinase regulating ubiquinone biosynthesis (AarF/ABC1/UbiB family)